MSEGHGIFSFGTWLFLNVVRKIVGTKSMYVSCTNWDRLWKNIAKTSVFASKTMKISKTCYKLPNLILNLVQFECVFFIRTDDDDF